MKLLFHLVVHLIGADVRRFRVLLAVWVVVQVADAVFRGMRPTLIGDPELVRAADLLGAVLFLIRWLGLFVFVPLIVQTHPLVASDAFWMTRPIPWRALLASKVVLLVTTFVAVPALCGVGLMLASRVPVAEIALVTLQTIFFESLWLAVVMALSALTRNLARFALVVGSVLVALVLLMYISIAVMMRTMDDGPELHEVTGRSQESPVALAVMLTLLIVAAVLPLVMQYRTRSTRASVALGIGSLVVVYLIVMMWPWPARPLPVPAWAQQPTALRLVAASSKGEFRSSETAGPWSRSGGWQTGSARLELSGVEAGWIPSVRLADGVVQLDAGTTLRTAGNGYAAQIPFESADDSPHRVVIGQLLGATRLQEGWRGRSVMEAMPAIVVSQADFTTHKGATGTYRGRFLVNLDRVEIAATLPLRAGAEFRDRGRRIVVDQVIPQAQTATIQLRQFVAATIFRAQALPQVSFYLRNRDRAEAVAGTDQGGFAASSVGVAMFVAGASSSSAGLGSGFSVTGSFIRFPETRESDHQVVDVTPEWLSRAELVIVHTAAAGAVWRTVEIPGFEIAAAPSPPPR